MFQIFASSKDEIALILLGSKETENRLNYKNIKVTHPLLLPSWELVQFVEDLEGTMVNADWLDAIVVAMDVLKEETECVECYYYYYYYYYYYHHHHHHHHHHHQI
jgi:hypothetical protein